MYNSFEKKQQGEKKFCYLFIQIQLHRKMQKSLFYFITFCVRRNKNDMCKVELLYKIFDTKFQYQCCLQCKISSKWNLWNCWNMFIYIVYKGLSRSPWVNLCKRNPYKKFWTECILTLLPITNNNCLLLNVSCIKQQLLDLNTCIIFYNISKEISTITSSKPMSV